MKQKIAIIFLALSLPVFSQQDVSFVGNVYGDAKEELILINTTYNSGAIRIIEIETGTSINPWVNHTTGAGTFSTWMDPTDKMFLEDVIGDSKKELILVNTSYSGGAIRVVDVVTGNTLQLLNHGTYGGWMDPSGKMFMGDANGDGKKDLVLVNTNYSGGAILAINLVTGGNIVWIGHGTFGGWMDSNDRMLMGDVNGDNKDDLVFVDPTMNGGSVWAVNLFVNSITTIASINNLGTNMLQSTDKVFLTDMSGDGKKDLFLVNTIGNSTEPPLKSINLFNQTTFGFPAGNTFQGVTYYTSFKGFMDPCDRIYAKDLNGDSKAELILVNTSSNCGSIRIVDALTGESISAVNNSLEGWVDPADRILFAKQINGTTNIVTLTSEYVGGALRTFNYNSNWLTWIENSTITPSLVGWVDGVLDLDNPVSACTISSSITWDKVYSGDGSIEREVRPVNYQLYPRNVNNQGTIKLSGSVAGVGTITFKVNKTNSSVITSLYNTTPVTIVNNRFNANITINAELSEYSVYYNIGSGDILIASNVVCGDAYIISGQSNATGDDLSPSEKDYLAINYGNGNGTIPPNQIFGKYSRSYGNIHSNADAGFRVSDYFSAGTWGLILQHKIQTTYGIPTCFINGGVGGTSIEQHLPLQSNPTKYFHNKGTWYNTGQELFAFMNSRVYNAGLENNISGIFWLQGDGGGDPSYDYISHFTPLYNLWNTYYSNFKKSYLIQIGSWPENEMGMRTRSEYQRKMPGVFAKMTGMTFNGVGFHRNDLPENSCGIHGNEIHHYYQGYGNLANRLFALVAKDNYGNTTNITDLTPPNIVSASKYLNRISLTFDQNISTTLSDNLNNILSVIKFNNGYNVKSNPLISGNVFSFDVTNISGITSVSYAGFIPNQNCPFNPDFLCYLKNSQGIPAFSFNNMYVQTKPSAFRENSNDTKEVSSLGANVYPNPFTNELTIHNQSQKEIALVCIYSIDGKKVYEKKQIDQIATLDLSELQNAFYIISIMYKDNSSDNFKIIKK